MHNRTVTLSEIHWCRHCSINRCLEVLSVLKTIAWIFQRSEELCGSHTWAIVWYVMRARGWYSSTRHIINFVIFGHWIFAIIITYWILNTTLQTIRNFGCIGIRKDIVVHQFKQSNCVTWMDRIVEASDSSCEQLPGNRLRSVKLNNNNDSGYCVSQDECSCAEEPLQKQKHASRHIKRTGHSRSSFKDLRHRTEAFFRKRFRFKCLQPSCDRSALAMDEVDGMLPGGELSSASKLDRLVRIRSAPRMETDSMADVSSDGSMSNSRCHSIKSCHSNSNPDIDEKNEMIWMNNCSSTSPVVESPTSVFSQVSLKWYYIRAIGHNGSLQTLWPMSGIGAIPMCSQKECPTKFETRQWLQGILYPMFSKEPNRQLLCSLRDKFYMRAYIMCNNNTQSLHNDVSRHCGLKVESATLLLLTEAAVHTLEFDSWSSVGGILYPMFIEPDDYWWSLLWLQQHVADSVRYIYLKDIGEFSITDIWGSSSSSFYFQHMVDSCAWFIWKLSHFSTTDICGGTWNPARW